MKRDDRPRSLERKSMETIFAPLDDDEPLPIAFASGAVCANGFSDAGRFAGFGAYESVHWLESGAVEWDQTPRRVAAHTLFPPKRSRPIVVDSSSVPPTRVHVVFDVGFVSTKTPAPT